MGCESTQYGSIERYLILFLKSARENGHSIWVVYDNEPKDVSFKDDLQSAGGQLVTRGIRGKFDWKFILELQNIIKHSDINVVHGYFSPACHYAMVCSWALGVKARLRTATNMPLLTYTVSHKITPWSRAQFGLRQQLYSWFSKKIIMRSEAMRREYLSLGVSPDKLVLIQGSVDTEYFFAENKTGRIKIRTEFRIGDSCYLVGTLARLVPVKQIETLLKGMSQFLLVTQNAKLIIAGDGPLRSQLEELAQQLGIANQVIFAGHRQDNRDILAALDVFVLPSLSEGASNSLAEAMASGLPIVASDIGPNASLVVNGQSGLLFPVNNHNALASALETLWRDRNWSANLAHTARARVVELFGIEKRIESELALYEELIKQ